VFSGARSARFAYFRDGRNIYRSELPSWGTRTGTAIVGGPVDLFDKPVVIAHGPVLGDQAVDDSEHVDLCDARIGSGDFAAGKPRKAIANMAAVRREPDHDSVAVAHHGVMLHASVCVALVQPAPDNLENREAALSADVIEEVRREQLTHALVTGFAPTLVGTAIAPGSSLSICAIMHDARPPGECRLPDRAPTVPPRRAAERQLWTAQSGENRISDSSSIGVGDVEIKITVRLHAKADRETVFHSA